MKTPKVKAKSKVIRSGSTKRRAANGANGSHATPRKRPGKRLVVEMYGGEPYEYYPLGKYIVAAPGVCDGHPTFKYTRVEVVPILEAMANGWTVEKVVDFYQREEVSERAVREAVRLASKALLKVSDISTFAA